MSTPFCAKSDGVTLTYFLLLAVQDAELQIWKEVGSRLYYSRLMPTAPIISPEEAAELAYYGREVVRPFTMDQEKGTH